MSVELEFPESAEAADPAFVTEFLFLAELGCCDSWGGMESRRVYREWVDAGRPNTITEFIKESANRPPE